MGNSLLDIIVFGRNAGINAAKVASETEAPANLTLSHVNSFKKEMADAGIVTDEVSPRLLPDYARKVNR
jgi:succinate dehydrogenase / fumarate reductase flavoprotein subunit